MNLTNQATQIPPDERLFREHVKRGIFLLGEADEKWHILSAVWPKVFIWVAAAARVNAPDGYTLRFDLSHYPQKAPTAQFWDSEANVPLPTARWPQGATGSRVARAFNHGWRCDAIYMPCDRVALDGHGQWPAQYRRYLWTPNKDITFYLNIVYDLLHSAHYQGVRGA